jgi:hypothetical protein
MTNVHRVTQAILKHLRGCIGDLTWGERNVAVGRKICRYAIDGGGDNIGMKIKLA